MKKITLFCAAALLLTGCHTVREPIRRPTGTGPDNSPIVIGDGSIHIRHDKDGRNHFQNATSTSVDIDEANYFPLWIGYQCDPDLTSGSSVCTSACNAGSISPQCKVDLSTAGNWDLTVCQADASCPGTPDIHIKGSSTASKITITTASATGYFLFSPNPDPAVVQTGELGYVAARGSDHLGSANLAPQSGAGFTFQCTGIKKCLNITYKCTTSGSCLK
jgi:hypothetical protein